MASLEVGGNYQSVFVAPAASKTDVLTGETGHWYLVDRINICASDGSAGTADIIHYDAKSTTEFTLKKAAVIPAADSYSWIDVGVVLKPGDILRITPSRTGQHVRVFFMSVTRSPQAARIA
jgi:hypothetical protein